MIGTPVDDARATLIDLGFNVKIAGDGVYRLNIPADGVAKVDPPAGTSLEKGETVTLVPLARAEAREGPRPRGEDGRGSRTHPGSRAPHARER